MDFISSSCFIYLARLVERHSILLKVLYKIFALIQWNCFFSLLSHNPPIKIARKTQNHVCELHCNLYNGTNTLCTMFWSIVSGLTVLSLKYKQKILRDFFFFISKPSVSPAVWRQMRSGSLCVFACLTLTFCRERHKVTMHFFEVSFNHKTIVGELNRSFGAKVENVFSFSY